jgi:Ca2+-binding RTX toxin-like protein
MTTIFLDSPSTNAAENVARIKTEIEKAHAEYVKNPSLGQVTVQLGAGTWVVTGDKSGDKDDASTGAIELLSGVALIGTGNRETVIKLEDNFNSRINGIVRTDIANVENVTISNLVIDGNRANNTTGNSDLDHQAGFICGAKPDENGNPRIQENITIDGVEIRNCTAYGFNPHETTKNITIKNSIAHNNGLDGFVADNVIGGTYEKNISYDNDRHGFNIQNASTDLLLKDNTAYDNGFRYINKEGEFSGGAGITIQRGDIPPNENDPTTIPWVSGIQILGGSYHDNGKEGILVKLSDEVTIVGAHIYGNKTQGVKIEGSTNTVVQNSTLHDNAQGSTATVKYDEINIRLRDDTSITGVKYYSTGTHIIDNVIDPENARYAIHEEQTNTLAGSTGTVISGNSTDGIPTDGPDTLAGSDGPDAMAGGLGDDVYTVNHTGDVVTEKPNEGTDHVYSSIKYILGDNIENLTLTGVNDINGYGNTLDNILIGNSGSNMLDAGLGNDSLDGGAGNDTLDAGAGNDTLTGGSGADTLIGGDGDDVYYVDDTGDVIIEKFSNGAGGNDTAYISTKFALSLTNDEVETLILTGSGNISVDGGSKANTIIGNSGNNILDGRGGIDTMSGSLGDDTYYVDHTNDVVNEAAGEGIDTIISSVSISTTRPLTANVENLRLVDPANPSDPLAKWAIEGAGNQLNNSIIGNSVANKLYGFGGNDTLDGGAGADSLYGGAGDDVFILRKGEFGGDTIADFTGNGELAGDRIEFVGFSSRATLTNAGNGNWTVTDGSYTESFRVAGGAPIHASDYTVSTLPEPGNPGTPGTPGTPNTPGTPSTPATPSNPSNPEVAEIPTEVRNGSSKGNTLTGNDNINVMKGLGGNDVIKGRGADDKLYGGTGNDKVFGDSGDDWLYGDDGNDLVYGGIGNDRVYGGAGNDKVYGDAGNDKVYGGGGHDTVVGGSGDDVLDGDFGNDILYGNAGSDAFVFSDKLGTPSTDRKVNFDTIKDFSVPSDSLWLDNAIFRKLGSGTSSNPGQLNKEFFVTGTKAREKDDYLIYNKKTGVLSYDADGSGSKEAVEFAQLSKNLKLTYKDFFVI